MTTTPQPSPAAMRCARAFLDAQAVRAVGWSYPDNLAWRVDRELAGPREALQRCRSYVRACAGDIMLDADQNGGKPLAEWISAALADLGGAK